MTTTHPGRAERLPDSAIEEDPKIPANGPQPVIVVGIDGSPASDQALLFAAREAQLRDGLLRIVTSYDLSSVANGSGIAFEVGPLTDALRRTGEELVHAANRAVAAHAQGSPARTQTLVVQGRPSQVLLDAAEDAELLVVGARGAAWSRLLMGSTSTEVVHRSRIPVTVVPCHEDHLARS